MNEVVSPIVNFKKITFFKRIVPSIRSALILISLITLGAYILHPSALTLLLWSALFFYILIESINECRFYISKIELIEKSQIKIEYLDNDFFKNYTGDLKSLSIEKKFIWYKIRLKTPYLRITDNSSALSIKQYEIGKWSRELMSKVVLIKDNK